MTFTAADLKRGDLVYFTRNSTASSMIVWNDRTLKKFVRVNTFYPSMTEVDPYSAFDHIWRVERYGLLVFKKNPFKFGDRVMAQGQPAIFVQTYDDGQHKVVLEDTKAMAYYRSIEKA